VKYTEYTISIKPYFKQTCKDSKDVPSDAEIAKFIQQQALPAIKENITVYQLEKMGAHAFSYNPSTRTIFFKVSGTYTRKQVEDYVKYLSQDSLEDTYYEGEAGKGLIVASKSNPKEECGVIDYRRAIKLM
jgi:adenine-specific DNA methylase